MESLFSGDSDGAGRRRGGISRRRAVPGIASSACRSVYLTDCSRSHLRSARTICRRLGGGIFAHSRILSIRFRQTDICLTSEFPTSSGWPVAVGALFSRIALRQPNRDFSRIGWNGNELRPLGHCEVLKIYIGRQSNGLCGASAVLLASDLDREVLTCAVFPDCHLPKLDLTLRTWGG